MNPTLVLRVVAVAAAVVVLCVGVLAALVVPAFLGIKQMVDGEALPGGAHRVVDGYVAAYLVPIGPREVALVDCGSDAAGKAILAALSKQGLDASAVKAILLTHGHPDHTGGCQAFPEATVMALEAEQPLVEGRGNAKGPLPSLLGGGRNPYPVKVGRVLKDGEAVQLGTATVTAYALPGHTAGSAAYLLGGGLYVGDTLSVEQEGTIRAGPWIFNDDTPRTRASVAQLAQRLVREHVDVKAVIPAHSEHSDGLAALTAFAP